MNIMVTGNVGMGLKKQAFQYCSECYDQTEMNNYIIN